MFQDTYNRIKSNYYTIPGRISIEAEDLIRRLLQTDPERRPTIHEVFMSLSSFKKLSPVSFLIFT